MRPAIIIAAVLATSFAGTALDRAVGQVRDPIYYKLRDKERIQLFGLQDLAGNRIQGAKQFKLLFEMAAHLDRKTPNAATMAIVDAIINREEELQRIKEANRPDAPYLRGLASLEKGDYSTAITEFSTAIMTDPSDIFPYLLEARDCL